jgi:hypothetical protein
MGEQTFQLRGMVKLLPKTSIPKLNQTLLRMGQLVTTIRGRPSRRSSTSLFFTEL